MGGAWVQSHVHCGRWIGGRWIGGRWVGGRWIGGRWISNRETHTHSHARLWGRIFFVCEKNKYLHTPVLSSPLQKKPHIIILKLLFHYSIIIYFHYNVLFKIWPVLQFHKYQYRCLRKNIGIFQLYDSFTFCLNYLFVILSNQVTARVWIGKIQRFRSDTSFWVRLGWTQ